MPNPSNVVDLPALLSASPRFASVIAAAESLAGDERREAVREIATGFFRKSVAQYIALGGPLADELAAHLPQTTPANDCGPVPVRDLDLVHGMTETAPPRIAAASAAKAQAEAEAKTAKANSAAAKRVEKWIAPKVKAAAYKNVEDIERAVINYQKTAGNVKLVAACVGATLHAGKIDKTDAEALIQRLHEVSKVPKAQLKASMKDGQPSINPEFKKREEEKERASIAAENAEAGFDFLPREYVFNADEGIFEKKVVYGKDVKFDPVCRTFKVVGLTLDQGSSSWGLVISFTDKAGTTKEVICYDSEAKEDPRGLSARLTGENLKVYCSNEEFSRFLLLVGDNVEKQIVTFDKPGWHEVGGEDSKLIFVAPTGEVIGADDANREYRLKQGVGFKLGEPPGDLETWKAINTEMAAENPHWAIGAVLGLVGVVIQAANLDSCGINLSGESSKGKTTAQRQGASCWTHTEDKNKPGLLRVMKATTALIVIIPSEGVPVGPEFVPVPIGRGLHGEHVAAPA